MSPERNQLAVAFMETQACCREKEPGPTQSLFVASLSLSASLLWQQQSTSFLMSCFSYLGRSLSL